jgi:hypothetical protein
VDLERGIPSKYESSTHADYVPALCTHRPSLLPIRVVRRMTRIDDFVVKNFCKSYHLEEGKGVTRFP